MNSRVHRRCYITLSSLGNLCKDGSGRLCDSRVKVSASSLSTTTSLALIVPCMTKQTCVLGVFHFKSMLLFFFFFLFSFISLRTDPPCAHVQCICVHELVSKCMYRLTYAFTREVLHISMFMLT